MRRTETPEAQKTFPDFGGISIQRLCVDLRFANRMLRMLTMKGYWMLSLGLLAFCTVTMVSGCSSNSGWGAAYGGIQLQQDGPPPPPPEAPSGSGAVGYIPQGNF
jgi:hypothetical protein